MTKRPFVFAFLIVAAILIFTGILANYARHFPAAPPRVLEEYHTYPPTMPSTQVNHTFQIRNDSDETLHFSNLDVSCACTNGTLRDNVIPPHESTTLTASVLTPGDDSSIEEWIRLRGERGDERIDYRYYLRATAANLIHLPPSMTSIDLGNGKVNAAPVETEVILSRGPLPLPWDQLEVSSDSPQVTAMATPIDADHWRLAVAYLPESRIGTIIAHLNLRFKQGKNYLEPQVTENVTVHIAGPVAAAPTAILFGVVHPGNRVTRSVALLTTNPDEIASIEDIRLIPPNDHIHLEMPTPAHPTTLQATYIGGDLISQDKGEIAVRLKGKSRYELRINYLAKVIADKTRPAIAESNEHP